MLRHRFLVVALVGALVSAALAAPHRAEGVGFVNWSAYQQQAGHGSHNAAATAITPANASGLVQDWRWTPAAQTMPGQPGPQLNASPTVYNGRIYIGSKTGVFYALDETTGAVIWQRFVGYQTGLTCTAQGFASTATVAPDPQTGDPTVYVGAFTGEVYALNAADGAIRWKKAIVAPSANKNDYALWASPTVANGHIYVGTSSACDRPLVRAGVVKLSQATGAIEGNYYTQAAGRAGGSVWSSVAVDPGDGSVYVSTGNPASKVQPDDSYSIVRLNGTTMAKTGVWTVPVAEQTFDADFGASPTLFTATIGGVSTKLVGACNKNGKLYVLDRDDLAAGPVWQRQISVAGSDPESCIGGLAFDGTKLYQASNATTIGGTSYKGSIRALNPATGAVIWEQGLPNNVIITPTVNGSGVMGIGTFDVNAPTTNKAYLINTANGNILRTFTTSLNGGVFGQMVFADNYILIPSVSNGMRAFRPATGPPPASWFTEQTANPVNGTYRPFTGDFTGGAGDDVVFYAPGAARDYLWTASTGGTFTSTALPAVNGEYRPLVGDFAGDAHDDILWWAPGRTPAYLWRSDGAGGFARASVQVPAAAQAFVLAHRAGPDEVLWYNPGGAADRITGYRWPGTAAPTVVQRTVTINGTYRPIVGDFDGNGWADVLWYAPGSATDQYWRLNGAAGAASTGQTSTTTAISGTYAPAVGRFSASKDGRDDIAWYAAGGPADYVWEGTTGSTFVVTGHDVDAGPTPVHLRGPQDSLYLRTPGEDGTVWVPNAGPDVIRLAGNSAFDATYRPIAGDFAGTGDSGILWYAPGPAAERLFLRRPA